MTSSIRIKGLERREKVLLRVNGEDVSAYRGENLLAALMAAGFRALRKSPVLGEARGGLCGMGVCFECLVTVNGKANTRACMVEVEDGMEVLIDV